MMSALTFLEEEQIFGNRKLDIFNKIDTKAALTDFSILLGAFVSDDYYAQDIKSLENRTGWYWTRSDDGDNDARVVYYNGGRNSYSVYYRHGGARPALPYSLISSISSNVVRGINNVLEVEYGEYPQKIAPKITQQNLENLYNYSSLTKTGKSYTVDSRMYHEYDEDFQAQLLDEYIYEEKKYVRVSARTYYDGSEVTFSDGQKYKDEDYVWVEVSPIKWYVDEKSNLAISKNILFSGVQFNNTRNYKGDFDKTDIKYFIDNYFSKDIIASNTYSKTEQLNQNDVKNTIRRQNPYNFNFDNVSEEDIIRGAIESDIAVFLHGRSSEGKSARVKQFDPDCEIIYLRNATPESLNGKSVYNQETKEMIDIPPTWFKKIKKKCEDEPDKLHIIFFDEITNALPSIQGMAFNIVLDGEVNGIWKLPENARIVAAGNDLNDSLAANMIAEPLFNRFAHVYINTTVDSWLKWASTPKEQYERLDYEKEVEQSKIHPSIYAYIAYKSFRGEDALRTPYNGEKPNADPRKWEMASKVLYATKNPEMLRALIGEDLTRDFAYFCKQQVISVEDVIKGNYSDLDFEMNTAEKFATAVGLSSVDEKNLETVRKFVMKMGAEICATFDTLWTHGDEKRLEYIAELKMAELSQGGIRR